MSNRINHCRVKTIIILLSCCLFFPCAVNADDAKERAGPASYWQRGFRVEANLLQMRDDLLIPLRFTGPALGIHFDMIRINRSNEHRFSFHLTPAAAFDQFGHGSLAFSWGGAYSFLAKVYSFDMQNSALWIGPSVKINTDDMYFIQWDDAHLYWFTTYTVGPAFSYRHALNQRRFITVNFDLPVAGFISRSPEQRMNKVDDLIFLKTWISRPHEKLRFSVFPDILILGANIEYQTTARRQYHYGFAYRTTSEPKRTSILNHSIGVKWNFGGKK